MSVQMVMVPPEGAVEELMVDRRTGHSWTVNVEPFELAATVVTNELWNEVHGVTGDPTRTHFPKTEVSWREAILFCNALSTKEGLAPVYEVLERVSSPGFDRHIAGQAAEAGVFGVADSVLGSGVSSVRCFKKLQLSGTGVGDKRLVTPPLDVLEQ